MRKQTFGNLLHLPELVRTDDGLMIEKTLNVGTLC
jgi:hypothetical protein